MPAQTGKTKKKYGTKSWGKEFLVDLEVPSGELCQVRRPGIAGLIAAGLLDSMDTLTALVQTEHVDRVEKGSASTLNKEEIGALLKDKDKLLSALALMDNVVAYVVNQPHVELPEVEEGEDGNRVKRPIRDEERHPEIVYTDMIEMVDKVYIFQYVVGGVSDLEQFRKEFGELVDGVETVSGI
jgi:hypothetical protein